MNDPIMTAMRSAVLHSRHFMVRRPMIIRELRGRDDGQDAVGPSAQGTH